MRPSLGQASNLEAPEKHAALVHPYCNPTRGGAPESRHRSPDGSENLSKPDIAAAIAEFTGDAVRAHRGDGPDKPSTTISKEEAAGIENSYKEIEEQEVEAYEPQTITAHLQISRPDFNPDAKIWKFRYGDKIISVDISDTNIAEQIQARGLVRIGDTWRVKMIVTEKRTASGRYRNEYKAVEVLEFIPAPQQMTLMDFIDDGEK